MHIFLCFEQKRSSIIVGFYLGRVFQILIIFTSDSDNRKRDLFAPLEQYETPDKLLFCFHSFHRYVNCFSIRWLWVEGDSKIPSTPSTIHPLE